MDKYLEDDEILNILEQSESVIWSASSDDGESDHLSVEELSSSEVSDTDDDSQNLNASSTCFISRNKKENWSSTPCTSNTGRTAACNIFRERTGPSRYAKSHANQNLIHLNYSSEIYTAGQDSGLDKCRRVACIQRKLDCYRSI